LAGRDPLIPYPVATILTPTIISRHYGRGPNLALVEVSVEASDGVGADGDDMDTPCGDYVIL